MFKRIVTMLLALCLSLCMLTPPATANEADDREARAFMKFPEPVEVHIGMSVDPTDATLLDGDTVDNNVYTRHLLENFNIKVVYDWTAATGLDFNQKLSLCIAGNSLPDAVVAPDRTYFTAAAKADMLYDLTDVFAEYASQALLDTHASTGGRAVQISSIDGRLKAMPNTSVGTDGVIVMFIRQDWLDQLGLEVPKTVSEISEVARAFKDANLGANGVTIPIIGSDKNSRVYHNFLNSANWAGTFDPVFQAYDAYPGYWLDVDGKVEYGTLSAGTKAALEVLAQWYAEGLIDPEIGTRDQRADPINAGQVGIFFGPWWAMGYGYADIWKNTPDANWQSYPVYADDGQWYTHMKEVGNAYTLVNKNVSEDVAKAIVIMANVYKRDEAALVNQTTEAISWYPLRNVMAPADESEYEYHELFKVLKGEAEPEDYNIPGSMYPNMYADALCARDVVNYHGQEQLYISDFDINHPNFNRMYAILIGDRPVSTLKPDKEVYSITYSNTEKMTRYWSNLEALEDETILKIITGKLPIDAFDEFVQQWLDEGGNAMLEEVATLR